MNENRRRNSGCLAGPAMWLLQIAIIGSVIIAVVTFLPAYVLGGLNQILGSNSSGDFSIDVLSDNEIFSGNTVRFWSHDSTNTGSGVIITGHGNRATNVQSGNDSTVFGDNSGLFLFLIIAAVLVVFFFKVHKPVDYSQPDYPEWDDSRDKWRK